MISIESKHKSIQFSQRHQSSSSSLSTSLTTFCLLQAGPFWSCVEYLRHETISKGY
jgi:hypothetical protein